jgi:hypothetical protein
VSDDGTAAQLQFPAAGLTPLAWTGETGVVPLAVEVAGCKTVAPPAAAPEGIGESLYQSSLFYKVGAKITKPREPDKPAETATLAASASQLVIGANGVGTTVVTVKLPAAKRYALTLTGGTSSKAGAGVTRRADGAFALAGSGVIELTLSNLVDNQTVQLELRPIDDKDQLGAPIKTLALTARMTKI